ncbi:restriction endonuclease, SacI family [Wenyingzhuangia sp. chi5]|uniref:Restriction endonuclease, SacI family n=1 Tax=Wenyingzhuangia gilva TaxID=3057677 RepID=A0ABT8VVG7_9FLAO|nr:restriction endonuclease, SacI family [Wenyingzhuangia sp. chi5]MDO3695975.1 restriction endonuclease, SacI family [Wenyingzhuangia sp. chi5]
MKNNLTEKLEEKIISGMLNTCKDLRLFSDQNEITIKPEYLINVNIAKSIAEINKNEIIPIIKINLEEKTSEFSINAVPTFSYIENPINIFNQKIRGFNNTSRNGNIDITIYENNEPHSAIEVKLVNPNGKKITEDILRLEELLYTEDNHTGKTNLKSTFFTCFEICENSKSKNEINKHKSLTENKYSEILDKVLKQNSTKFKISVNIIPESVFNISQEILSLEDSYYLKKSVLSLVVRLNK